MSGKLPDDRDVGKILLATPTMQMLEVTICSRALDLGVAVKLDMGGGRTGRHVQFRPSRIIEE